MDTNRNCPYFGENASRAWPLWPRDISPSRILDLLVLWEGRVEQRRRLAQLDDRMLRDIGIGRSEAYRESSKWFWQD